LHGEIVFDQVSFTYPDSGIKAIDHVSFRIKPGEKVAIIGRTASGKSTIADLMLRMYEPTSGRILMDGLPLQEYDLKALRESIAYVPQDVFLFSDTIEANIRFGSPKATREEVERYARHAAVYDDIIGLPDGFETRIGERGITLSGGQKQRISIARALIKQPDLVILDDCLSAVDTHTEHTIIDFLNRELANKTSLIITHRILGMLEYDRILVLENGRLVEQGTHEELLANQNQYYELWQQQQLISTLEDSDLVA
jgi:ATP-binding cassette subfamily B protein